MCARTSCVIVDNNCTMCLIKGEAGVFVGDGKRQHENEAEPAKNRNQDMLTAIALA